MNDFALRCPVPSSPDRIQMAHGGGGRLTAHLIERIFLPAFTNPALQVLHDGPRLAFTTDSFVVSPLEFPGGDIGHLAVCGTVNDLAMCGARPLWLSAGFILEEGLPFELLGRIVESMRGAALAAGVNIVTGDTKVVDNGKGDGIFIHTAGMVESPAAISPAAVRGGDAVVLSGDLGRHGIAVLSVREGLEFEAPVESDVASLWPAVDTLLREDVEVHCLRDLTRGGLATALNEIATASGKGIQIEESKIPLSAPVRAACELLGLDPLYLANEGRFAAFVAEHDREHAVEVLRRCPVSQGAVVIGQVSGAAPRVDMRTVIGSTRVLDLLSGEQLPRIC
jgi:hydrogenase expression/formation protein HypE